MSLTRQIFEKLNESAEVKKTYGDKPQEGKTEKLERGKKTSIPNGKASNKVKANKLQNVNNQAADAYANDTDKVMDKVDSKEQSDKGKVAKATGTKSDKKVKFPFGDKPQKSDSKLIKESDELKESENEVSTIANKEEFNPGSVMNLGYKNIVEFDKYKVLSNGSDAIVLENGSTNYATKYNSSDNNFENFTQDEYNALTNTNLGECTKTLKEDYDNDSWMKHQTAIENELEAAKEEMEEDAFLDFIDGVINLCQNYGGQLNQLESAKIKECNGKECK